MNKILAWVLPATLIFGTMSATSCSSDDDQPEPVRKMVVCAIDHYKDNEKDLCDSLLYDNLGRLVSHHYIVTEDTTLETMYTNIEYFPDRIEEKMYDIQSDGSFKYRMFTVHYLDANGRIATTKSSNPREESKELVNTINYKYDSLGQLTGNDELTFVWDNGNMTDSRWNTEFSSNPTYGFYPVTLESVNSFLFWMGYYGKLPKNLPANYHTGSAENGQEANVSFEYELKDGRVVSYDRHFNIHYPKNNLSLYSNNHFDIHWKEIVIGQ